MMLTRTEVLTDYVMHCATGRSMRDLARGTPHHASTVMRRVRQCEELRENPEWDAALTALCGDAFGFPRAPGERCTPRVRAEALGFDWQALVADFTLPADLLGLPGHELIVADMPDAAVMYQGKVVLKRPRQVAVAAVALQWVVPVEGWSVRLRRYGLPERGKRQAIDPETADSRRDGMLAARVAATLPASKPGLDVVATLHRRSPDLMTSDHAHAAARFRDLHLTRGGSGASDYRRIAKALPERLMTLMVRICGEGHGLEAVERDMGLSARSGKVLLVAALEVFALAEAT